MRVQAHPDAVAACRKILKRFEMCDSCLGRQLPFYTLGLTNRPRGRILRAKVSRASPDPKSCYVCKGLMTSIGSMVQKTTKALRRYEYQTFLVGTSIPPDIQEREDRLRAEFKLRGAETLKSEVTREIAAAVAKRTGKRISHLAADVTILADFLADRVAVRARAIHVFGRYVKKARGLDQKQKRCPSCKGKGCALCNYTGIKPGETVESILAAMLLRAFKGAKARFTWIGGEDRDSLVLGKGRPFYAEIQEPKVRRLVRTPTRRAERRVVLSELGVIAKGPPRQPEFTAIFRVVIETDRDVPPETIKGLEAAFANRELRVISPRKRRTLMKRVHELRVEESGARRATILLTCDGGLNIKKFVSGSPITTPEGEVAEVSPNLSEALGAAATCVLFDVLNVELAPPEVAASQEPQALNEGSRWRW